MQRARPLLAWVTITTLSTLVTWQVVAAASDEVNDVPRTPLVVAVSAPPTTIFLAVPTSTETSQPPVSSTVASSTPAPAVETTASTTTAPPPPPPGPSPTSTTQPPSSTGVATVGSAGGTVTVSYGDGQVYFEGATPLPGYSVEVEDEGPEHVVVAFESEEETIEVRVEWRDGELVSRVETED